MAATPEIPRPEVTQVQERPDVFPETIQKSVPGVKVVQKNFKAQVSDNQGQPVIQTPPSQVITVTPPADDLTLTTWAKGDTTSALTWLGAFWIRVAKKALHFGWKIISR